ncbi:hypothetical protein [Fluviispira vulneris]|nr:hypothetical protein [Fluviispira vulneris]
MRFSFPFLATHIQQMPLRGSFKNFGVEVTVFNRSDLENESLQ